MPMDVDTHVALGLDQPTPDPMNGRSNNDIVTALNPPEDAQYEPCSEAMEETDSAGDFVRTKGWNASSIYPDTERDVSVYLPPSGERRNLNLIIFNDGAGYSALNGPVRATRVLDTLHARGEIRDTAAIFINPGNPTKEIPVSPSPIYNQQSTQRSIEYDTLSPAYGEFLLRDVLPWAAATYDLSFSGDPSHRTVCGISSGGICAFSVAWFHPNEFSRVISHCGSFTNIRGGHNYPYLVRATERKNIRVFLQSGENDGATIFGDWPTANLTMAKALEYAGYDYRFEYGQGGHSLRHGGALFADTLRWLWRDA